MIAGTSSTFSYTLLQDCSIAIAADTLKWKKDRSKESVKAGKSLVNDIFC